MWGLQLKTSWADRRPAKSIMSLDALTIELDLAWRRVLGDSGHRHFVTHPHLRDWVEHDRQAWLQRLASEIGAGYAPRSCHLCLAPKAAALVRPGAVLCPEDEVIYTWLVGRFHMAVWQNLAWSQGNPDCAYQILPPVEDPNSKKAVQWIRGGVRAWTSFRQKSLSLLTSEVSHVVISDVTGFYDNIDLPRLASELKVLGTSGSDLDLLSLCLRRWNHPRGKGIPQGYTASDILAKVYAHPLDRALRNEGFVHLRFVDDIRIFCRSRKEARQSIVRLTELLLARGLNLQAAKTKIYTKSEGKSEIEGIAEGSAA